MQPPVLCAMLALGALVMSLACPATANPKLAWTPPTQMRAFTWPRASTARNAMVIAPRIIADADTPVKIAADELLVVPVVDGDLVRVAGGGLAIGFGSGTGALPDAVVWSDPDASLRLRRIHVPTWGGVTSVIIRSARARSVEVGVHIASSLHDPMAWYRADEAIWGWLGDPTQDPPALPDVLEDMRPAVRLLAASVRAWGPSPPSPALRALLQAAWLGESLRHRPTTRPHATVADVELTGGEEVPALIDQDDDVGTRHRLAGPGETIRIQASTADVVSLLIRGKARGTIVLGLYEGDALVRELRIIVPIQGYEEHRWTPPRSERLVLPATGRASIRVLEGTARVSVRGYRLETSSIDKAHRRNRRRLLARASKGDDPSEGRWPLQQQAARALARLEHDADAASVRALARWETHASLSAEERALVRLHTLRHGFAQSDAERRLADLWLVAQSLPKAAALPILRSALSQHLRARPSTLQDPSTMSAAPSLAHSAVDARDDDRVVVALTMYALAPPQDGQRSLMGDGAERHAALASPRSPAIDLAADVWRNGAPWANLTAEDSAGVTTRMLPVISDRPGQRCPLKGPMGVRWLKLDSEPRAVDVEAVGGTHTRVRLVVDPDANTADAQVYVDDVPLIVHGAAGLASTAAVSPGLHKLRVIRGPAVLARVPSEGEADCHRLRDELRWVKIRDRVGFTLPPGQSDAPVSLVVASESVSHPTTLRVRAGGDVHDAWLRPPASGAIELTVPRGATEITVQSDRPVLVRLRARLHRLPKPPPRREAPAARAPTEAELLERVRESTVALRASDAARAKRQRLLRAAALERLGFGRLAQIDRTRAGAAESELVAGVNVSVFAADLPSGSPSVVPLGALPLIAVLPNPSSPDALREVLDARDRAATPSELIALLGRSAEGSVAADALLLAELARQDGQLELASRTFERLGRAHRSAAALIEASETRLDVALSSGKTSHSLLAYILARDAEALGGMPDAALARLSTAITFDRVEPDRAAGSARIEQAWSEDEEASLGERVRRALVDAPAYASIARAAPTAIALTRVEADVVRLDWVCHAVDGEHEECEMALEIDGEPVTCDPPKSTDAEQEPQRPPPPPPRDKKIARPMECRITLPEGAKRLAVAPPTDREVVVWVAAHAVTESGLVPITTVGTWTEIDPERPFETLIRGPTVLRVAVRGAPGRTDPIELELVEKGRSGTARKLPIPIDPRVDDHAVRFRSKERVSRAMVHYVTIVDDGRYVVTLRTAAGRAMLRLDAARAEGMPRQPTALAAEVAARGYFAPPTPGAQAPRMLLAPVGWDRHTPWMTLGVRAGFVASDLSELENDRRDDFGELGLTAQRELWADRLWLHAAFFQRIRKGPLSHGGELRLSLASEDLAPGGYVEGRIVGQRFPEEWAMGSLLTSGVVWTLPLTAEWSLGPVVAFTLRDADSDVSNEDNVDQQVYSRYAETRPRSMDLVVRASHHRYVDLTTRYQGVTRLAPDFDGVDRVDLQIRADMLVAGGLAPWLRLDTVVSYRPVSPEREKDFVRGALTPSVLIWHWLSDEGRLALQGGGTFSVDVPALGDHAGEVAGAITISYDHVFGRGLTDWPLAERPFRQRLEEGAAPARRDRPDPPILWRETP